MIHTFQVGSLFSLRLPGHSLLVESRLHYDGPLTDCHQPHPSFVFQVHKKAVVQMYNISQLGAGKPALV